LAGIAAESVCVHLQPPLSTSLHSLVGGRLSLRQPGNPNLALRVTSLDALYLFDSRVLMIEIQDFTRETYIQMAMPVGRAVMRYDLVFQFVDSKLIPDEIS